MNNYSRVTDNPNFAPFESKMKGAGMSAAAIASFRGNFEALCRDETGMIPESTIESVEGLPRADKPRRGLRRR